MPFFAYREEKKMDLIIVVAGGYGKGCVDIAREVYDDIVFFG